MFRLKELKVGIFLRANLFRDVFVCGLRVIDNELQFGLPQIYNAYQLSFIWFAQIDLK